MVFELFQWIIFLNKALGDDFNPDCQNTKASHNSFKWRESFPYLLKFISAKDVDSNLYEASVMPVLLQHNLNVKFWLLSWTRLFECIIRQ